ncbi:recombinase family protein [uncultured Methylobacterium sp.]|jgi:DNA invertase Pin-like site-specific DNA recombinase|uniref:recombinase family protein n=1 Tax=uncultured Methylobacterium sp. TaxID=157278 RepID=UPI0026018A6A|nr:recombinase family protein [uncultured Methylobacterium sp.]
MAQTRFISYLRVSTGRQAVSGLGLEAQRRTVADYLAGGPWDLVGEFIEVESGKRADRPELAAALARCRAMRATLIVANVSRLTRSVAFLSSLLEAGIEVRFCDLPQIEGPTGRFLLTQMAAVAELEAGLVSDRTRKALAAAKARGVRLGSPQNLSRQEEGRIRGRARRTQLCNDRAADLAPIIAEVRREGARSPGQIAAALDARGIPAARGGTWSALQVQRVLRRLPPALPAADPRPPTAGE